MKHLKIIFKPLFAVLALLSPLLSQGVAAQRANQEADMLAAMDSIEFSLLTCQPHDEVYSLYGHTAIRYHDLRQGGIDAAFNYGVFDFNRPFFVLRFVFGLTDYELGAYPFHIFCAEYRQVGSMVTEQVLNLSATEKARLQQALTQNLKPQNRIYRYNYFYNNCTTKARDIIEQAIDGNVIYAARSGEQPTYREMVHAMTEQYPWSRFGNDFLLGVKADKHTDLRQQEFLPGNLMYDFDHATIRLNGQERPLIKERRVAVAAGVQMSHETFPLTPNQCGWTLAVTGLLIAIVEWVRRRSFVFWNALLMITTGTLGILLTLMLFSQHPTVSLNLQFILFNPIHLFFLWSVVKRRPTIYWDIISPLIILFAIGGTIQHYPEAIYALALCLLLQCVVNRREKAKK